MGTGRGTDTGKGEAAGGARGGIVRGMGDDPHFRRTARQPLELGVRFRRDAADAPFERSGQLIDLGMGGAQIQHDRPPPTGERLRVQLTAPSAWDPLDLEAEVKWSDGSTFGVQFAPLSASEANAMYELLAVTRFAREEAES